jgi:rubrerythrin
LTSGGGGGRILRVPDKRKAHVEALQIALDTEKKGYRFYKIAASSTSDPEGRHVFEQLAKDEIEHMGVFATLYRSLTNDEPWMTYEEAVTKFGETPPDQIIFPEISDDEVQEEFNDLDALREALQFEEKAVSFYSGQAAGCDDERARSFYESLIEIEKGHVKIVQAELDSLMNTGIWLGYQEISLED